MSVAVLDGRIIRNERRLFQSLPSLPLPCLKSIRFFFNLLSFIFMLDRVNPTFLVEQKETTQFLTIEPMIKFDRHRIYKKYINNDGLPTSSGRSCQLGLKCLAFVHWTLVFTGHKFLICDVQG